MGRSERCWRLNTTDCKHITRSPRGRSRYAVTTYRQTKREYRIIHLELLRERKRNVNVGCTASVAKRRAVRRAWRKGLAKLGWAC